MDKWVVKKRNVAICDKCNGAMALWYNSEMDIYALICDYCPNGREYPREMVYSEEVKNKNEH